MFATGLSVTINPLALKLNGWWKLENTKIQMRSA
jgi:hypothetical protein